MLLPTLFLLPVMVVKCLFLLLQPLDMIVMELFQTFVIKLGFDWSVFCLHDSGTDTTDGILCTLGVDISKMPFDESVVRSYNDFMEMAQKCAGMSEAQMRDVFYPRFGNTFYYEYFLIRNQKLY